MKITIISLFPEMFSSPFEYSIIKRAIEKKIITLNFLDLRTFGIGKHKTVDDTPYGGGKGMVLRVDVLHKAIEKAKDKKLKKHEEKIILLTPTGITYNQKIAKKYSKLSHLIIICGHYEGFDERVNKYIDEKLSIGDFILTGGEIGAMLITDSVARLVKGVIQEESWQKESFSPLLEHPHYTKPRIYDNVTVPEIILSGNHKKINDWRIEQSLKITQNIRPDLLKTKKD